MRERQTDPTERNEAGASPPHVRSMHEGVDETDDPVCCCEPEPRWQAVAEELAQENQPERNVHSG